MSETINFTPERPAAAEQAPELPEHAGETFAELPHEQPEKQQETARQAVEQAQQQSELPVLPAANQEPATAPTLVTAETRRAATNATLKHVRRRLPAAERALSRVVHQPVIKALSETGGKTVSRPSGLLGGGACAFLGSGAYLYLAKHIGFQYNYLMFILLFVGGFVIGLAVELLLVLARTRSRTE